MSIGRIGIVLVLFIIMTPLIAFSLKQCAIIEEHRSGGRYTEEVSRETSDKKYFHSDDNSYVGSLEERDGNYILTIVNVATGKEYTLSPNEVIETADGEAW